MFLGLLLLPCERVNSRDLILTSDAFYGNGKYWKQVIDLSLQHFTETSLETPGERMLYKKVVAQRKFACFSEPDALIVDGV